MKADSKKVLYYLIFFHIILWTAIPTIVNTNLPLDTIEALAWGNDLKLGYDKYHQYFHYSLNFFLNFLEIKTGHIIY